MKSILLHSWRWPIFRPVILLSALVALPVRSAWAQAQDSRPAENPPPAAAGRGPGAAAPKAADGTESPIQLSPFEVNAAQDHGYFSPTTLAGTRLNNNIADLPSSISIVTKQLMLDTNSQNINDVFRYEANTEGASTYTPITLVRGNVADVLGNAPLVSGNRVRGLNSADLEVDNFFSLNRIPFDSYNTQSIEIDRGPNSILFGTGSPAGIVNQTRARAVIDKWSGDASIQVGNWGSYRDTVSLNIPLISDKLAVYVAQSYNSRGFEQEPSYDDTRREYAAFTFVPFKNHKTKLSGSFEYYNNSANDPNFVTPVDFVTPWLASGRPIYNALDSTVTYLSSGATVGPYAALTSSPNYVGIRQSDLTTASSPYFVPSMTYAGAHMIQFIDSDNNLTGHFKAQQNGFTVNAIPADATADQLLISARRTTWSAPLPIPAGYQIWQAPSVVSKSIYDWNTINMNAMARSQTSAKSYYLDLQQEILPHLNLDLGWFRQELKQFTDQPVSQANATTLYVDTNAYRLDGQPNPHVGQPFVDTYASDVFESPETNNNLRASLAYELDLTDKVPSWLTWLGHHRFVGVVAQHRDVQNNLRYRESIIGGDPNYLPTAATLTAPNGYGYPLHNTAIEQWFYLGGTGPANGYGYAAPGTLARPSIDHPTQLPITSYNYATNTWDTSDITVQSILYPSGGLQENLQNTKTFFWQSFFFNDRIVGTLGVNQDQIKNRQNVFPTGSNAQALEYPDNVTPDTQYWRNYSPWSYSSGRTTTTGVVLHPFKNWKALDTAADSGNLLAGFARTLSLTFNNSGNFNPLPAAYTDFFGNPLGTPGGSERDYGLEIATPDNKLFLRVTKFKTTNSNQIVSNTSNARALYIDANELKAWATAVVEVRSAQAGLLNGAGDPYPMPSGSKDSTNFNNTNVYPITSEMQDQIAALTGLPYNFGGNVGEDGQFINPFETENGIARGTEVDLVYNPLPHWRMKVAWGEQKTILSDIASQAAAWVDHRLPVWQTYTAPDIPGVITKTGGTQMSLSNFWTGYGYDGNIYQGNSNGWNTTQDYYNIVVAGQLASDRALNNTQATNQRQYTWSFVSSYDFDHGPAKGFTVGGAVRYLGEAVAGYYGDTQNLSPSGLIFQPDINRPIYSPSEYHIDAWLGYQFKLPWADGRIHGRIQFNISDLNVHEHLQAVTYNYDGSAAAQRIVQGRTYSLTTRLSF